MSRAAIWIVAGLLASGAVLVGVELAKGALDEPSPKIANPCEPREGRTGGFDGLDGAACRLHTTREELVLSLGGNSAVLPRRWDQHQVEVALRAGLLRSVDEAVRRGDVPEFLAPTLRSLVRRLPLDRLVQGGFSLSDLIG